MGIPRDNPAELEARLMTAIDALRRISEALTSSLELASYDQLTPDGQQAWRAVRASSVLCASYAASVVDEVTS